MKRYTIKYCAFCAKPLKDEQEVFCCNYHAQLARTIRRRESLTPMQRMDYLKLNSSEAAHKEAIKLINK